MITATLSPLMQAIAAAAAADEAFELAVKAAGFKSRWDHGVTAHESVHKAYMAKLAADDLMHHEFNLTRAATARAIREARGQ